MSVRIAIVLFAFLPALYILRLDRFSREDWKHVLIDLAFLPRLFGYTAAIAAAIGLGFEESPFQSGSLEVASRIGVRDYLASHKVITFFAFVLWTSYINYWFHRLLHKIEAGWELHKVHHSATRMTGFSWLRMHPIDEVLTNYVLGILTCIMVPELGTRTAANYVLFISLHNIAIHSEWRASWGRWSWVFTSPAAHQIHHSTNPKHFNSNFGAPFSVWDRLHGTYVDPFKSEAPTAYGVDDVSATNVRELLISPIARSLARLFAVSRPIKPYP